MYGYALVDSAGYPTCVATGNVSPTFVAKYERDAKDVDPVLAQAYSTGRPTYNRDLMAADEWEESAVYRRAYCVHAIRHVIEIPVINGGQIRGNVHFATSEHDWDFSANDIQLADAIGGVLAFTIEAIESRDEMKRERDQALVALELAGTPLAVSDPLATAVRLNDPARRLLVDVVDAEERLHRLLARSAKSHRVRRIEVELTTGETGILHGRIAPGEGDDGALIAVLELEREQPSISPGLLSGLTPREQEVAALVVEGLANPEIAEALHISRYTVSQYVKRIYRKLDVNSRVALTRALLGPHGTIRRPSPSRIPRMRDAGARHDWGLARAQSTRRVPPFHARRGTWRPRTCASLGDGRRHVCHQPHRGWSRRQAPAVGRVRVIDGSARPAAGRDPPPARRSRDLRPDRRGARIGPRRR